MFTILSQLFNAFDFGSHFIFRFFLSHSCWKRLATCRCKPLLPSRFNSLMALYVYFEKSSNFMTLWQLYCAVDFGNVSIFAVTYPQLFCKTLATRQCWSFLFSHVTNLMVCRPIIIHHLAYGTTANWRHGYIERVNIGLSLLLQQKEGRRMEI